MMPRTVQELEAEALKLTAEARGELAVRLLDSLEPSDAEIRESWIREAERRAEEMRSGRVRGEPIGEVLARIRTELGQRQDAWPAIERFRSETDLEELDVDGILDGVRDLSPGRE